MGVKTWISMVFSEKGLSNSIFNELTGNIDIKDRDIKQGHKLHKSNEH